MTRTYVIADWHLSHENILRYRPQFSNIDEHDKFIIDRCNETVNPTDTLILAGDIILSVEGLKYLDKVNCRNIIAIPGNHCGERFPIPTYMYSKVIGAVVRRLPNCRIQTVISHIPVHPHSLERWKTCIHGHHHDSTIDDPRYFNCTAELNDYRPVSLEHIAEVFKERGIK